MHYEKRNVFVMTVTSILCTAFSTFKHQKVTQCPLETNLFRFQVYKNTTKSSLKYMKSRKMYFSTIGIGNTGPVFTWYKISTKIYRTAQH